MTGKTVSFFQDSNTKHSRVREKGNTLLKGFNNHHIKNTCFASGIFSDFLLLLIFVNDNLFSDRDLACSSNRTYNFFNSTLFLHRSPEVIACNNRVNFLTNIFNNTYFSQIHLADQFYKIISNVNSCFYFFYYSVCLIYLGILNCLRSICLFLSCVEFIVQ